jgi:[ribosomal protein S5]-alanine N-acetyltransferase
MEILETNRLLLRRVTMDDLEAAHAVLDVHPDVWRYDPGHEWTIDQRRERLEKRIWEYRLHGFGCLAVTLKPSEALIGYCGLQLYLWEQEGFSTPEVEWFYKFGRDYWGQGLATEASRAVIDHAFGTLRLRRLVTHALRENSRSTALMGRMGMTIAPDPLYPDEVIGILYNPSLQRDAMSDRVKA